ncbi:MAG: 30S ribosomal protein S17 [Flavobacteriaceae bacterium]
MIYSKKVQLAFRKATVVGDITNSDYFGEIAAQGDTVKIMETRPLSKRKCWRLVEIIERAK